MRRAVLLFVLVLTATACGGSDGGFYDEEAKAEAQRAAKIDPFDGHSQVVTVESLTERDECPQAPSFKAGPCMNAVVRAQLPARDLSGDETGQAVRAVFDVFIWLEKRSNGRWEVTHKTYRPKDATIHVAPPGGS